jgi:hypothetical protein
MAASKGLPVCVHVCEVVWMVDFHVNVTQRLVRFVLLSLASHERLLQRGPKSASVALAPTAYPVHSPFATIRDSKY